MCLPKPPSWPEVLDSFLKVILLHLVYSRKEGAENLHPSRGRNNITDWPEVDIRLGKEICAQVSKGLTTRSHRGSRCVRTLYLSPAAGATWIQFTTSSSVLTSS